MLAIGNIVARAECDAQDRLTRADEPLAGLQTRCGGAVPGAIAVPELLDIVRKARSYGFRLARAITAFDGAELVTAWVEIQPLFGEDDSDEAGCCEIVVRNWQTTQVAVEDTAASDRRRTMIDRHLAELTARLDGAQRVLSVETDSPELAGVAAAMAGGLGKPWTDFVPPENFTQRQPLHWRLLDGARVCVAGSQRPWRVALVPQFQPGFDPTGFELLLVSDAPSAPLPTVHLPAEPLMRRSLVGQDLAPVLRQPIARIIANAETIRTRLAGPLPDAYAEYAGEIAGAGKLLLGLLEDLADLEVVESDNFDTIPDHIDLSEVARQGAGILNVRAQEKGIRVEAPHWTESLPAIAEFRRVLQIMLNLIGNAVRYSPEGSQVWIRLDSLDGRAYVTVADQGPGLALEDQERVFEKFERLGRSGDGGSGLGLYISRCLARAMGGDLTVESAPGQGARFILELPADREA
ncbi:histidine kinase/DNA gyrase B/HSP90-like ATPase [Novosphingobium sp. PhB165]|uniref:sensor histidine kinase n=1 Tax=Novosphingobium sp. PhB165 TaxID=2485105 RepID=UPI001049911E|nr:sensor histidine kinase [Novosphingobium sp. PhB165]TCM22210.1 histidine kinase/DNA gyrase B/HSP90-like ATPase [Novosphingobium sp. PhB165]